MLIYSGDVDACVPYVGSEAWTTGLGFPVLDDWHQWTCDSSGDLVVSKIIIWCQQD